MTNIELGALAYRAGFGEKNDNQIRIEEFLKLKRFADAVAQREREACAKLCEAEADDGAEGVWDGCCVSLANKIRARGEA